MVKCVTSCREGTPTTRRGEGYGRSAAAALAGTAAGLFLLLVARLACHLPPAMVFVAAVLCLGIIPGYVIGLIDRRRPILTTAIAPLAASLLVTGVGAAYSKAFSVLTLAIPVLLWAAALAGVLVALRWGRSLKAGAASAMCLGAICALILGVPEMRLRWQADWFMRTQLAELHTFARDELVALPDGVRWQDRLSDDLPGGLELNTEWPVNTDTAGPGRCQLMVKIWPLPAAGEPAEYLADVIYKHRPYRLQRLESREKATALLGELGLKVPPGILTRDSGIAYSGSWQVGKGRNVSECTTTVFQSGRITARRLAASLAPPAVR
jgi:hypothetical protein